MLEAPQIPTALERLTKLNPSIKVYSPRPVQLHGVTVFIDGIEVPLSNSAQSQIRGSQRLALDRVRGAELAVIRSEHLREMIS